MWPHSASTTPCPTSSTASNAVTRGQPLRRCNPEVHASSSPAFPGHWPADCTMKSRIPGPDGLVIWRSNLLIILCPPWTCPGQFWGADALEPQDSLGLMCSQGPQRFSLGHVGCCFHAVSTGLVLWFLNPQQVRLRSEGWSSYRGIHSCRHGREMDGKPTVHKHVYTSTYTLTLKHASSLVPPTSSHTPQEDYGCSDPTRNHWHCLCDHGMLRNTHILCILQCVWHQGWVKHSLEKNHGTIQKCWVF